MTDKEIGKSINSTIAAIERLSLRGYADWALGIGCVNELNAIKKEIERRMVCLDKANKEDDDGNLHA